MSYRMVMAADLQGYGAAPQNVQELLQRNLVESLREAAGHSGLDAAAWKEQGSGDGLLMVLPHEVSAEVLAGRFVRELNGELRARNRLAADRARTRMRLAIHHGPATEVANGFSGTAPVAVTRLCNCDPLRAALDRADADLGVIVSELVFRESVEAGMTSLEPAELRRVRVARLNGDRDGDGWLWLPGGPDPHTLDLPDEAAEAAEAATAGESAPPPEREGEPPSAQPPGSVHVETVYARTYIRGDQHRHYYGGRP
ncbi:hypothetical protein HUT06_33340 [Actinomadura sp. NAK00032]|uniref:hypothetical protein n=1 Tax=Actinomadura sp. NAK00032 TaxID=2742128 RepID=UPI001590AEEB|nr:hypothetical protein [Actinomadura sp. NAK00032]QKW38288.1 hypothetical protein HUT06_33340 [Actinomadura sp. NAK00032]